MDVLLVILGVVLVIGIFVLVGNRFRSGLDEIGEVAPDLRRADDGLDKNPGGGPGTAGWGPTN